MAMQEKQADKEVDTLDSTPQQSMNLVTSDLTMQTMQQQMELMKQMMETLKSMQGNSSVGTKKSKRNPNQSKYCWTHGLCSHNSSQCRTPADGCIWLMQLWKIAWEAAPKTFRTAEVVDLEGTISCAG